MTRLASEIKLIAALIKRGLQVMFWPRVPDQPDAWKGPRVKDWPTKSFGIEDYQEGMQVGVKLGTELTSGRFLVDLDLDWAPGTLFIHRFVPEIRFAFGRPSKPMGHVFLTTNAPVKSRKFVSSKGGVIAEVRGTKTDGTIGLQTIVPPSLHPTGEPIEMLLDGDIPHDDEAEMRATYYAVACELGQAWPDNGEDTNQHDTAAHAAGFLCARGVDLDAVPLIIEVAATLGNDNNVNDRVRYARDTVAKFRAGERKLTGARQLAAELGEPVVAKLREWLPTTDELAAAIERLNERFGIVGLGNRIVVMENRPDGGIKELWPFPEFKNLLIKERIKVDGKETALAGVWLKHKDGRKHDCLVYAMPGSVAQCGAGDYNGWRGFAVKPVPGNWHLNRAHLERVVCSGDQQLFAWLVNWMAALVQWPGRHAFTAVVLRGGQGVGKGHFAHQMLGALFHPQQYIHVIGASTLTGRFNEHLSGKVLVFADESTWGGDPQAAERVKGMVTEDTIVIERKFLAAIEEPSALHIVIASNNTWPIAIAADDRRFTVLDVSDMEQQNDAHFLPLRKELKEGGLSAMLYDLLAHEVNEAALRHPPTTKGKLEIIERTLPPIQRWWLEKLKSGRLAKPVPNKYDYRGDVESTEPDWPTEAMKSAVHADYITFLKEHHESRAPKSTETELGAFLLKYSPLSTKRRLVATTDGQQRLPVETQDSHQQPFVTTGGGQRYFWVIPPLDECRAFWIKKLGWPPDFPWDDE